MGCHGTRHEPGAWVTVTITGLTPGTVTVIVAVRVEPVFCKQVAIILPFPLPDGVTVHQVWLLKAIQLQPAVEVTAKVAAPAAFVTFWFAGVTLKVQGAAA